MMKLDKWTKARIRTEAMHRAERARSVMLGEAEQVLITAAKRRIEAEWGAPECQADMLTLLKYKRAAKPTGANLRVYDPATQRYEEGFGVKFASDLFMPHDGNPEYCYWSGFVRPADSDYADVWQVVELRREQKTRGYEERQAVEEALKATASLRRVVEQFPWIAELFSFEQAAA